MSQMNPLPADESLESLLRGLAPAAPALERDRLMYLAGQAAARPARFWGDAHWGWPASLTGVSALAATALLALLLRGPAHRAPSGEPPLFMTERAVPPVEDQTAPQPRQVVEVVLPQGSRGELADQLRWRDVPAHGSYLAVRERVAAWGVDAWPAPRAVAAVLPAASRPSGYRELLEELLDLSASPVIQQPAVAPAEES